MLAPQRTARATTQSPRPNNPTRRAGRNPAAPAFLTQRRISASSATSRQSAELETVAVWVLAAKLQTLRAGESPFPRAAGGVGVATEILLTKAEQASDDGARAAGLRLQRS
jgi:hypothetical protein